MIFEPLEWYVTGFIACYLKNEGRVETPPVLNDCLPVTEVIDGFEPSGNCAVLPLPCYNLFLLSS